jgi:glycosyltransferase involved in cell wall biosynthesis
LFRSQLRILYDHQVFSLQNAGGASRYFYELAKYMSGVADVQTDVLMGINATVYPFRELESPRTRVAGLPGWLRPGSLRYAANEAWGNLKAATLGTFDIYHPTTYLRMPMVRTKRAVATHHDCTHERFPELFPDVKKVLWARKWLFPRVDAIICVSESCRQDLLHFYDVDPAKTFVIHHGLSALPRNPDAAADLSRIVRRDYILYVGMRAAFKNFRGLLHAMHDSGVTGMVDLLVLGGGELADDEKALINKLGLADNVIALPKVSDEFLAEAYARARLFVYPSLNEGFGFPPLEAMSLGCPVLASRVSSIPEVCGDAPFYFDPAEEGALSRGLSRALTDEPARQRAIAAGTEVAARYSWRRCGEQTLAIYRQCQ